MARQQKKKSNHFVPQSYLVRFHSVSERQVGLYNLKSSRTVEIAPIKSQCARDCFYTKNPAFEEEFGKLEGIQKQLLAKIVDERYVPETDSPDHHALLNLIMFQAGRTATSAALQNHLANEFGKAVLRKQLEKDGRDDLLEYLPKLKLSMRDVVMDSIVQHLTMCPLIGDLEVTLFINESKEDFLTSDHPVALCNNLPKANSTGGNVGFASRGLLVLFPISPRALIFLSDPEVYKVTRDKRGVAGVGRARDVVELNLPQCFSADENLYFAAAARVQETLSAFRRRQAALRSPAPVVVETEAVATESRNGVLLSMRAPNRRMSLPRAAEMRRAAKTEKYVRGDAYVRDPVRRDVVRARLDKLLKKREQANESAAKKADAATE